MLRRSNLLRLPHPSHHFFKKMASKWIEYDAKLLPLIEEYGTSWKEIAKHLPKNITISAARNRWMRLNQPKGKKAKNRCKLCGQTKRGHNWVTCKRLSEKKSEEKSEKKADSKEQAPTQEHLSSDAESVRYSKTSNAAEQGAADEDSETSDAEQAETATFPYSASRPITPVSDYPMSDSEDLSYHALFEDIDYDSLKSTDTNYFDEDSLDMDLPHADEEQLKELQKMISDTSAQLNQIRNDQMLMSAQIQEIKSMVFRPHFIKPITQKPSCQKRMHLTESVREHFVQQFQFDRHPSTEVRETLAQESGLSFRQVDDWFTNRRKRSK